MLIGLQLTIRWLVMGMLIILMYPYMVDFASEVGGQISKKLVVREEISNSSFVIGRSGISNSSLNVGMGITN